MKQINQSKKMTYLILHRNAKQIGYAHEMILPQSCWVSALDKPKVIGRTTRESRHRSIYNPSQLPEIIIF